MPGKRVFITYAHWSEGHRSDVLALAQRLRRDGVDAWLDRFEPHQSDWYQWMERQLEQADVVVCVCSEAWKERYDAVPDDHGDVGARFEARLIRGMVAEARGGAHKVVPVVLGAEDRRHVPNTLKTGTIYVVADDYEGLYAHLTGQSLVEPAPLGQVRAVEPACEAEVLSDGIRDETPSSPPMAETELPPPKHIEVAVASLESLDPDTRRHGIDTLAQSRHERAGRELITALDHPLPDVAFAAAVVLAQRRCGDAARVLVPALADAEVADVAESSLETLGNLAAPTLFDALRDGGPEIRRRAAGLVGKLESEDACRALLRGLEDEEPAVRRSAAEGLARLARPTSTKPLIARLSDSDRGVRDAVVEALGANGDLEATRALADVLRHSTDTRVRIVTTAALGRTGNFAATPILVDAIAGRLPDPKRERRWSGGRYSASYVARDLYDLSYSWREAAARAIARIGDETAAPTLLQTMNDDRLPADFRLACWAALYEMGRPEASKAVNERLSSLSLEEAEV